MYSMKEKIVINPLKTSSMGVWNTGDPAKLKPQMPKEKLAPLDKSAALKGIVRKYQENQYLNYLTFIGELGSIGYCVEPFQIPGIFEVVPDELVIPETGTVQSKTSYGEYRRKKAMNESHIRKLEGIVDDEGSSAKKQKGNDGWGDDAGTSISNGMNDDSYNNNRRNKWNNDSNDRRSEYRGGGNNRSRGGFRGARGGRGRFENNRSPRKNDRFANKSSSSIVSASSGWSDDENSSKNNSSNNIKIEGTTSKSNSDGWDDDQKDVKPQNTPLPSTSTGDDWE